MIVEPHNPKPCQVDHQSQMNVRNYMYSEMVLDIDLLTPLCVMLVQNRAEEIRVGSSPILLSPTRYRKIILTRVQSCHE